MNIHGYEWRSLDSHDRRGYPWTSIRQGVPNQPLDDHSLGSLCYNYHAVVVYSLLLKFPQSGSTINAVFLFHNLQ